MYPRFFLPVAIVLFVQCWVRVRGFDYCTLKCGSQEHTVCRYTAGGGPECKQWRPHVFNNVEIHKIEYMFNFLRNAVAVNPEHKYYVGPIGDMLQVLWSDDLSVTAQRWAEQCDGGDHDDCRLSWQRWPTDQLTFQSSTVDTVDDGDAPFDVVHGIINSLYQGLLTGFAPTKVIVNAKLDRIGCGFSSMFDAENTYFYRFVCNFAGPGARPWDEKDEFNSSKTCSACPKGTVCGAGRFPGLCTPPILLSGLDSVTFCDPDEQYAEKYFETHKSNGAVNVLSPLVIGISSFYFFYNNI